VGRVGEAGSEEAGNMGRVGGDKLAGAVSRMKATVVVGACALSEVFVIVGDLERWGECVCAMRVRGKSVGGAEHVAAAAFDVGVSVGAAGAIDGAGGVVRIAIAVEVDVGGRADAVVAETWGGVDAEVGPTG